MVNAVFADSCGSRFTITDAFQIQILHLSLIVMYLMYFHADVTYEDTATYICKVTGTSQKDESDFAVYSMYLIAAFF